MTLKFISTNTASFEHGLALLIWGESGAGKTRLAGTLPERETFILSAENGLLSLRNKTINGLQIDSVQDLSEAYDYCASPAFMQNGFRYIVLDSITEIGEQVLKNAKAQVKDPRQAYGELIEKVLMLVKMFRDLKGPTTIFLAKLDRIKDDVTGITMNGPSMPGKSVGPQLPYLFDEVFKIDAAVGQDKVKIHYIQTGKDAQNVCKDRSGSLDMYEPADLSHIINKILSTPTQPTIEE